jgi:hypothetical protein
MSERWEWATQDIPEGTGPWPENLCRVWRPLLELLPSTRRNPLKLANLDYLLARLAEGDQGAKDLPGPMASILSAPSMRRWIAMRAGRDHLAFRTLPRRRGQGHQILSPGLEVLCDRVEHFSKLPSALRAWVFSTLAQLTLYEDCVRLAQGVSFDLERNHDASAAYEVARVLQRLDVKLNLPAQIFEGILHSSAVEPRLRVASAIQFMVRGVRYSPDARTALDATRKGEAILKREYRSPRDAFAHALMCSRFFRAEALVRVVHGGGRKPSEATELATLWHAESAAQCGQSRERQQLLRENHRLVVEAGLKLATRNRTLDGSSSANELLELDRFDPDVLAFIAEYWAARGDWRRATALHLQAMRLGTVRSVTSSIVAGDMLRANGKAGSALRAYRRAYELDSRSTTAEWRILATDTTQTSKESAVAVA